MIICFKYIIIFALLFAVIVNKSSLHVVNTNKCTNLFNPCAKHLLDRIAKNNIITVSSVSMKFIVQIKNFWITSAIPNKFTNILFIANDYTTFNYCKTFTEYVLMGKLIINQTDDIVFMNKDYTKIMISRWEIIIEILLYGYCILINDLDIYFYKNPISFLLPYKEDIVIAVDEGQSINAGF